MISLTSPVETRAHGWPAGLKLGLLCLATMALFAAPNLLILSVASAICLLAYALPGALFFRTGLKRLFVLWPFVLAVLIWHMIIGTLETGSMIALRLVTAVGFANLVTMTTRLSDMMDVVRWLATPLQRLGLNSRSLEMGMALVLRFTPTLADKGAQLSQSWKARSPKRASWRVILPFTLLAIDDAEQVAEAIKARGGLAKPK
ncbi:MAG: energy-coupling factor transporter transmembrane component T [Hyphomicrobiales bacterium]